MLQLYITRSSYSIHMTKYTPAQPKAFLHVWFMRQISASLIRHLPQTTQFCNFQSRMKFIFSLHDTVPEWNFSPEIKNFIAIEDWNKLIPEWLVQK